MTRLLFIGFLALILSSCGTSKNYSDLYPKGLDSKVSLGMPLDDFLQLRGISTDDLTDDTFRKIYVEPSKSEDITDIVYYFDADGDQPLYEMIFIYKDEAKRDAEAEKLLGEPNDGEEWKLERKPYDILAWKYKNKLILVAVIPETEWAEEQ